ncbi:nucleosome assembly protein 1;4-like isoform X2 [Cynara cardunculus var. scolymus]|uniref:nucleosome assembly protein 1;4-like isoform X2 n=1 Tax=Cynara cardunculus var. scolymus TaxID=59895 RepID=UPI000D6237AE|nr:nucleosome assembly protein 1;4-like isoform X2 [Cynara cardunculus var. scolymus]XP_024960689.1 nucleosome assembly protein 1;4-like isoform X2 [Cynara cardunculus var. scolymus]
MSSRIMIRSCNSSLRTLIHRHLSPTVASTTAQTETSPSIYNFHYLLPNTTVPRTVNLDDRFSIDTVGYSTSMEDARGRLSKEVDYVQTFYEKEIEDDSDMDESVYEDSNDDDDDDDDDDYEDDDDEDATRSGSEMKPLVSMVTGKLFYDNMFLQVISR